MRRRTKRRLPAIALCASALLALSSYYWVAQPALPTADYPAPHSLVEAREQDLDYLCRTMQLDRSFSVRGRAAFLADVAGLKARAATLSAGEFELGIAHAVAHADNGHTNVLGVGVGRGVPALPLRFAWFEEGLFIIRAAPAFKCTLGARVAAIAGYSPEALLPILRPYVGGSNTLAKLLSVNFLVSPAVLHALGVAADPGRVHVDLADSSCERQEMVIEASVPSATPLKAEHWPVRDLSPVEEPGDETGWLHVLWQQRDRLPLYLQKPDDPYWSTPVGEHALYIRIGIIRDRGDLRIEKLARQTLEPLSPSRRRFVVVDLRASPGGNADLLFDLTKRLPGMLPHDGRVFVLVGPDTFSAAIITAARLKYFGGTKTLLVGEDMADGGHFWAEGGAAVLPNSRIVVRYARSLDDWSNGCSLAQIRVCHWLQYFYGVAAGDLTPNIRVPETFAAYRERGDPAMDTVEALW